MNKMGREELKYYLQTRYVGAGALEGQDPKAQEAYAQILSLIESHAEQGEIIDIGNGAKMCRVCGSQFLPDISVGNPKPPAQTDAEVDAFKVEGVFNRWWKDDMYTTRTAIQDLKQLLRRQAKRVTEVAIANLAHATNFEEPNIETHYQLILNWLKTWEIEIEVDK